MKKKTKVPAKRTLVSVLLDRTGSMAVCKQETIGGFNGYIQKLIDDGAEKQGMKMTVTQFDSISIDLLENSTPIAKVKKLDDVVYQPRGNTPLYDAIGKTIRATESAQDGCKVLFVVMTDGQENASSEWNEKSVKELIKSKESKDHWTFAYIGVGMAGWTSLSGIARGTQGVSNVMRSSHGQTADQYRSLAGATISYSASVRAGGQCVNNIWNDPDEKKKTVKP